VKEVRYNPPRPPDDPRDGPATYLHRGVRLTLTSDQWTLVDDVTAAALEAVPGMEVRNAGETVAARETPGAADRSGTDASGGSTPAPETQPGEGPEPARAQAMTAGRRLRRKGGAASDEVSG
jgi:hypothetical protein